MTATSRPLLCQDSHGCLAAYGGIVLSLPLYIPDMTRTWTDRCVEYRHPVVCDYRDHSPTLGGTGCALFMEKDS